MSCLATEPPQDTKPAGSPEAPRQEPDPCPESASIQSFTQSIKAKLPHHPESASASGPPETSSLQGEELSSSLEEKKTITPATKDLKSVSETSYEESMEVSFSEVTEPSVENKVSSVPKVEKEKDVGLFEDKMSESLMVEEREKVSEGLTEKDSERSTGALPLKEQETVTVEHQRPSDISLTVKEHAFEGIPADESTKSSKGLLAEQHERTTEECEKASESLSRKEREGASDGGKMEVSSEGLTVAECERHVVKEHERGLTVVENCGRSSEEFTVEERKKPSVGLPEVMDFSMDGERSLAKLSSLVEERTSLKPSAVRQPESFHCSVINPQSLSAPGEPSSNVPSATFIPLAPKIGMGKPAISKRKFSPGRPRVKQVRPQLSPGLKNLFFIFFL